MEIKAKTSNTPEPESNYGYGLPGRQPFTIPVAHDCNGNLVEVYINGVPWNPGSTRDCTRDEKENVKSMISERLRRAHISRFGDPDLPKKGVNIRVATIPGR